MLMRSFMSVFKGALKAGLKAGFNALFEGTLAYIRSIIFQSARRRLLQGGLAQTRGEIVFCDVDDTPLLTAEEYESDDISVNRSGTPDGANTSAFSISQVNGPDVEANGGNDRDGSGQNYRKVPLWEWIFLVSNLIVELPAAVFDQLSSPHKPLYALMAMALSLLALVLCIVGLLYKGVKEGITFECPGGTIPWFYSKSGSQDHKRFGTFADIIGLVCAISQCIVTAINYDFVRRAANSPIKFSLLPTIFALGLLCSRILETVEKKA